MPSLLSKEIAQYGDEILIAGKPLAYHQCGLQSSRDKGLNEEEARSQMGLAAVLKDRDATPQYSASEECASDSPCYRT